jgi:hypothetical protein
MRQQNANAAIFTKASYTQKRKLRRQHAQSTIRLFAAPTKVKSGASMVRH